MRIQDLGPLHLPFFERIQHCREEQPFRLQINDLDKATVANGDRRPDTMHIKPKLQK